MGVEVLDSNLDPDIGDDVYEDGDSSIRSVKGGIDARRKLEDRLEEMRLQRELRDYDFDV